MSGIINLASFADVEAIHDKDTVWTIYGKFVERDKSEQARRFAQSIIGGGFFLIEDERFPGRIVEAVASILRPDEPMVTLYKPNAIFNSLGTLLEARESLNRMLHDMEDATIGRLTYQDRQRGRVVVPVELSTMTLIRLLRAEIMPYFEKGIVA